MKTHFSPPTSQSASTAPPRHGRKPGATNAVSPQGSEDAHKLNHSYMVKLRREKINDALSSLQEFVPWVESAEGTEKKGNQEKDFKLEILERIVIYLTKLKKRVVHRSAAPSWSSSKHLRDKKEEIYDNDELADDEDNADEDQDIDPSTSVASSSTSRRSSIRLPTIFLFLSTSFSGSSQVQTLPYFDFSMSPPDSGRSGSQQPIAPPALRLPTSLLPKRRSTPLTQDEAASMLVQFSAERSSLSPRSPGSLEQYQQQIAIG
ncbi:hypothetical protein FRC01_002078 [Tulasnella sp. 417]|nr:hypothetical protein FRC01_002078 [Tulasnella sp. 417]